MPQIITDYEGLSFPAQSSYLGNVTVLIADADHKLALLVKSVLFSLGFRKIFIVHDGSEALAVLTEHEIDIIFSDWQMLPMDGIHFLRHLRRLPGSLNRMLPVIMLTARGGQDDVIAARDSGINEYVIKPFTARALLERIEWVIEKPRSFVLSRSYAGPDRRRKDPPPEENVRRARGERIVPRVVSKAQFRHLDGGDHPIMVMPDFDLKKKIGLQVDAHEIGEPLMLSRSEQIVRDLQEEFLDWIARDMDRMKHAFEALIVDPQRSDRCLDVIRSVSFSVKSRAGTFGFSRASEVAHMLYYFTDRQFRREEPTHILVMEKHINTLSTIFGYNMTGDGGQRGQELIAELGRVIHKCS